MHGHMTDIRRSRATSGEINYVGRIKASSFLAGSFSTRDNVKAQSNWEEKVNPSILKDYFSSRADPSIIEPVLLDRSNKTR